MWSAHAALPTNRPAAIAATMTVCFQTIIVVLHAVNAWLRLAARSAVSGLTATCSDSIRMLSGKCRAMLERTGGNPAISPTANHRLRSALAGRRTSSRTPLAYCRTHALAVYRAASTGGVVVWPGLNLGR